MGFIITAAPGTRVALMKMNMTYCGAPFARMMATDKIDLKQMNFIYCGAPFVAYCKG